MTRALKSNLFLWGFVICYLIPGALILGSGEKGELHLFFNQFHSRLFDTIFFFATDLGDGITAAAIILITLLFSYRMALIMLISSILSTIITQFLKRAVYSDVRRPSGHFADNPKVLHWVEGLTQHHEHSFPSGHATSTFAVFCCLALFSSSKMMQLFWLCLAIFVAYSRVYLSQHFFEDIYAGAIIGTASTVLIFILLYQRIKTDSGLLNTLRK